MNPQPRTPDQRTRDTLERLERDVDAWVATAGDDGSGMPYLVPLSFLWDGDTLLIATPASTPTGRNLQATGRVRIGLGPTRDLVLVDGTVQATPASDIDPGQGDAFAAKAGFDPRPLPGSWLYFHVRPVRIQAWREVEELDGRDLMRNGRWLTDR